MSITELMVKDLIENNKENARFCLNKYDEGYCDGYHDALVDLMNQLGISHNEEIINH